MARPWTLAPSWCRDIASSWATPLVCAGGVFLVRYLADAARDLLRSVNDSVLHLANLGVFQLLAWSAIFLLLRRARARVGGRDAAILALISLSALAPDDNAAWLGLTALGLFLLLRFGRDRSIGAAAAVMLALATQLFWGRLLFELIAVPVEIADARLAAGLLALLQHAVSLDDNLLNNGGRQIAIYEACTSFHNISLALLCWVALTKLARPDWRRADLATASVLIAVTVGMNSLRLFLMTVSAPDAFDYWHTGTGSQLINAALSALIPALCLWGVRERAVS
jgi:exosortase/archaeosortase family protein